jgi:hypothetical protein
MRFQYHQQRITNPMKDQNPHKKPKQLRNHSISRLPMTNQRKIWRITTNGTETFMLAKFQRLHISLIKLSLETKLRRRDVLHSCCRVQPFLPLWNTSKISTNTVSKKLKLWRTNMQRTISQQILVIKFLVSSKFTTIKSLTLRTVSLKIGTQLNLNPLTSANQNLEDRSNIMSLHSSMRCVSKERTKAALRQVSSNHNQLWNIRHTSTTLKSRNSKSKSILPTKKSEWRSKRRRRRCLNRF